MNTANPHGKARKCGAKTRGGGKCQRPGTGAGGRCRLHGGATPNGAALPQFTHGRRSKYLLHGTGDKYREALADRELMRIRQDVALVEALIGDLTTKLGKRGATEKQEGRLLALVEQRRRLIGEEARRLVQLQQTVTLAQFMATMKAVAEVVREFVTDDAARRRVQQRLEQLLLKPAVVDDDTEGGDDGGGG